MNEDRHAVGGHAVKHLLSVEDLEIIIIESPPQNWGIRGVSGDELSLDYRVDV